MTRKHIKQSASSSPVPSDFISLPYSSALLLDGRLDASVTSDPEYQGACEAGFDGYFHGLFRAGVCEDRFYTVGEVRQEVVQGVCVSPRESETPFAFCVGATLGWLSALALSQYEEAMEGLNGLMALLEQD